MPTTVNSIGQTGPSTIGLDQLLKALSEEEGKQFVKDLEECRLVCQRISGKPDTVVRLGFPGRGSYMDPQTGVVTLDPIHLLRNRSFAIFVSGHEGMHIRITLSPQKLGLSSAQIDALYGQLGFGYLQNIIEDAGGNDWMVGTAPGIEPHKNAVYDEMLAKENEILGTPEITELTQTLGRTPLFAHYGSEILRDWHMWRKDLGWNGDLHNAGLGRYSSSLDPEVKQALDESISDAREAITTIPEFGDPSSSNILEAHRQRFRITTERLYPKVAELIEKDVAFEELRQLLNTAQETSKELAQKERELGKGGGSTTNRSKLEQEVEKLKDKLASSLGISRDALDSIREAVKEAIQDQIKELKKQLQKDIKEIETSQDRQQALKGKIEALKQQANGALGQALGKIQQEISDAQQTLDSEEETESQLRAELKKKVEDKFGGGKSGAGASSASPGSPATPNPLDTLGDDAASSLEEKLASTGQLPLPDKAIDAEALGELKQAIDKLSDYDREALKRSAQGSLKKFEDALNKALEGDFSSQRVPRHEEIDAREKDREAAANAASKRLEQKTDEDLEPPDKTQEEAPSAPKEPFDQVSEMFADQIKESQIRLKRAFKPDEEPDRIGGQKSGRHNIQQVFRAGSHPERKLRVHDQRVKPLELNHALVYVVDCSPSMSGINSFQTFSALVFTGEVLRPIKVPWAAFRFSSRVTYLKRFEQDIEDEAVHERLAGCLITDGGTNDGDGLDVGWKALKKRPEKFKVLSIFTDAESGQPEKAKQVVDSIVQSKEGIVFHYGLGPNTEDRFGIYKFTMPNLLMSTDEMEIGPEEEDPRFFMVYTAVMEDALKNPSKYLDFQGRARVALLGSGEIILYPLDENADEL